MLSRLAATQTRPPLCERHRLQHLVGRLLDRSVSSSSSSSDGSSDSVGASSVSSAGHGSSGSAAGAATTQAGAAAGTQETVVVVRQTVAGKEYTWAAGASGSISWDVPAKSTLAALGGGGGDAATALEERSGHGASTSYSSSSSDGSSSSGLASGLRALWRQARVQAQRTFLPAGYPHSVAPGYLRFVGWQALHHSASAANGVLASTALLYAVGLGQVQGAAAAAGAANWVLKDGLGQAGSLLFGRAIAHNFDLNTRTWYLAASLMLNAAIGLEISTQLAPQHFLLMGSAANAVKGLAWMAGGSTRSAFNVSFQRDANIADITAKATSQTITTSLLGTTAGISLAGLVGQSPGLGLAAFASLAGVHLYSAYMSAKCVPLASLNPTRLQLLAAAYLDRPEAGLAAGCRGESAGGEAGAAPATGGRSGDGGAVVRLPPPEELCHADPAVHLPPLVSDRRFDPPIHVGRPLHRTAAALAPGQLSQLIKLHAGSKHLLVPLPLAATGAATAAGAGAGAKDALGTPTRLELVLAEDAAAADILAAYLHAVLVRRRCCNASSSSSSSSSAAPTASNEHPKARADDGGSMVVGLVERALADARRLVPGFRAALEAAGWSTGRVAVEATQNRAAWAATQIK